ncbi:hypothetical protein ACHQM5_018568 [Ranunculus cassubicifolius]
MSPASKSKGKEKSSSAKITKEQQKASSKPSATSGGSTGGNGGVMASAYNPLSGTFHTLETAPIASSPPPHSNGRFRNIDETDDHSNSSLGTGAEYDSVSNNDSCSGESEDLKEKSGGPSTTTTTARQEAIPGSDNDKREKIRQKNERKHQRQRERRAQELHERCSGYLMSRKLESLAQQLVGMGFSSERATMALILNEGRMEESVAWLFEGSEEEGSPESSNLESGSNLKIDITDELNQITGMEIKYKCSKQEVERAVVTCEGDLEKASEILKKQQELATCPPKPGETGDPTANNGKLPVRPQAKTASAPVVIQPRRDDSSRDFNYTKAAPPSPSPVMSSPEPSRNFQALRRTQPLAPPPQIQPPQPKYQPQVLPVADKRWLNGGGSSTPSVSYSLASPLQSAPPPSRPEPPRYEASVNNKIPTTVSVREPVIMMQRPQSINVKPNYHLHPATSINNIPTPSTAGFGMNPNNMSYSQQQFYNPQPYLSGQQLDTSGSGWGNSYSTTGASSQQLPSPSSSLTVPSSLGLFSGWGSTGGSGSSSPVDWNTGGGSGSIPQCDYTSIDWTLESTQPAARSSSGLWLGLADFVKNNRMYDSASGVNVNPTSMGMSGLANGGVRGGAITTEMPSGTATSTEVVGVHPPPQQQQPTAPAHEWTTPFAGKDLFSLPRQFVTSPSL